MLVDDSLNGELWLAAVHEFGDRRGDCANIGDPVANLDDITVNTTGGMQMFTQAAFMTDIGAMIGNSILMTTMSGVQLGCCVIGKGAPVVENANGGGENI